MGIEQLLLGWIADFLSGRQQSVIIDGAISEAVDVTSDVVAGSDISRLLFIVMINDLSASICYCIIYMFADGVKLLCKRAVVHSRKLIQARLNSTTM